MERETYKYVLALKVAEPKWAVRFIAGTELLEDNNCRYVATESIRKAIKIHSEFGATAWFGAINGYIEETIKTGNNEQGDMYEGVFARVKKNSFLMYHFMEMLGDDFESFEDENDNSYCFLRRKSSRYVCAFCMYGVAETDLKKLGEPYLKDNQWYGNYESKISKEMFKKFLQTHENVAGCYFSVGHFYDALMDGIKQPMARGVVQYDIDLTKEFCIVPDEKYSELFHKRKDLAYQNELRCLLINKDQHKPGIPVTYKMLTDGNASFVEKNSAGNKLIFKCLLKPVKERTEEK
jgi:hypothetical protein